MEFEQVIGLEIHIEMKTKTKMFSSAPSRYGDSPNTNTTVYDLAFPGTMPTVNKEAVVKAIQVCNALHLTIDPLLRFDRKNYFYSDLPKGYQITQYFYPLGKDGYIEINTKVGKKKINIERLHMEEDTAKQLHAYDCTLIDYNRCGTPLIEIVSKPNISSGDEAMSYIEAIRSIVSFLDVSDGKMEEGSLRCDINVSVREKGSKTLGTKVEIKNLNSIANVGKALDYEFKRQTELIEKGEKVLQETRRFDEGKRETIPMRSKTDSVDYKYYPEPNIVPIRLSEDFINKAINSSNELASSKYERYIANGLSDYDASVLLADPETSRYYDKITSFGVSYKLSANWVNGDIQSVLNRDNLTISGFKLTPKQIADIIKLIDCGKINNKQAREIFATLIDNPTLSIDDLAAKYNEGMISSNEELLELVNQVLDENNQSVLDYKSGHDNALRYLMGQVMKKTQGKVNPKDANEVLLQELNRR